MGAVSFTSTLPLDGNYIELSQLFPLLYGLKLAEIHGIYYLFHMAEFSRFVGSFWVHNIEVKKTVS